MSTSRPPDPADDWEDGVCGETYEHDERITYEGPTGVGWDCRNCGAEGFHPADSATPNA